jgi:hypothetical protein
MARIRKRPPPPATDGFSLPNGSGGIIGEIRERLATIELSLRYQAQDLSAWQSRMEQRLAALEGVDGETLAKLGPVLESFHRWQVFKQWVRKVLQTVAVPVLVYLAASGSLSFESLGVVKELLGIFRLLGHG